MIKKVIASTLMGSMMLSAVPVFALVDDTRLTVKNFNGEVRMIESDTDTLIQSATAFAVGTRFVTSEDASLVLDLGQAGLVRLSENSDVTVNYSAGTPILELGSGRLLGDMNSQVSIVTTEGSVVASSGEFIVGAGDQLSLKVLSGDAHQVSGEQNYNAMFAVNWLTSNLLAGPDKQARGEEAVAGADNAAGEAALDEAPGARPPQPIPQQVAAPAAPPAPFVPLVPVVAQAGFPWLAALLGVGAVGAIAAGGGDDDDTPTPTEPEPEVPVSEDENPFEK